MKKLSLILTLFVLILLSSCKSGNDRGQLVGVSADKKFFPEKPYGMTINMGGDDGTVIAVVYKRG